MFQIKPNNWYKYNNFFFFKEHVIFIPHIKKKGVNEVKYKNNKICFLHKFIIHYSTCFKPRLKKIWDFDLV